jgi:hypothetical protein
VFIHLTQGPDQCCGSGIIIPDPDFYPSQSPDPTTETKRGGGEKFLFFLLLFKIFLF